MAGGSKSVPLSRFFAGPHFDWSLRNASIPKHTQNTTLRRKSGPLFLQYWPILPQALRLEASLKNGASASEYLSRRPLLFTRALQRLGWPLLTSPYLDGCLLNYVLSPSATLRNMTRNATRGVPLTTRGLLDAIAVHARMGDSSFSPGDDWVWHDHVESNQMREEPEQMFACVKAESAIEGQAKKPVKKAACRACIVVSDSDWAVNCAREMLESPILTQGHAWHALASPEQGKAEGEAKLFLDWWLLATSDKILATHSSTFSGMASLFRFARGGPAPRLDGAAGCKAHLIDYGGGGQYIYGSTLMESGRPLLAWLLITLALLAAIVVCCRTVCTATSVWWPWTTQSKTGFLCARAWRVIK